MKHKIFLFSIFIYLFLLLLPVPAVAYPGIVNPDFVSGYVPWIPSGTGSTGGSQAGGNGVIYNYTSGSYDNSSYIGVWASSYTDDGESSQSYTKTVRLNQTVDVTGHTQLNFYAKKQASGNGVNTIVYCGNKSYTVTNTSWNFYSLNISGITGTQNISCYCSASSSSYMSYDTDSGYLYVDHFYFTSSVVAPAANFTANVTTVTSAQPIQFTDTSTNSPTSWTWDFNGDGVIDSTVQNPVVTYGTAGTYTVTLNASNAAGSDTETKTGYITITDTGGCIACNFSGVPTSGYTPLTVQFTDLSAVTPDTWAWNFGDGYTSTEQNPEHTYAAAGTYTVTMTVTKDTAVKTKTKTGYITVTDYASSGTEDPGPYSCDFTANVTSGTVPLTVLFNDTSASGANAWTWGIDGVYQADTQDLTVTFNTAGLYSINHTASGPAGSGSKTRTNYIHVYEANHGGIYGYIYDAETNSPISNVNCQFSNTSATASILTDSTGYYYFWPVWNGVYNLTVSKNGYTTGILPNTVIEGNTLRQDIYLTPSGDSVTSGNISNYSSDWLTFTLSTNEVNKTIALTYAITNGTAAYANCTIYNDNGIVYSSNISTNSGTFTFTGIPNTNYLVSFDVMNNLGNRYSGAYPILFYRGLSTGWNVFPADMPRGLVNGILVLLALFCMMLFGKAYIEIGMIMGTAVLAASYIWGYLNLPDSVQTPVIIFLSALIAGGEYIAKKKILG